MDSLTKIITSIGQNHEFKNLTSVDLRVTGGLFCWGIIFWPKNFAVGVLGMDEPPLSAEIEAPVGPPTSPSVDDPSDPEWGWVLENLHQ